MAAVAAESPTLRAIVRSGQAAPGGGTFERFNVELLPIIAPVNARGQVAFFATLLRAPAGEAFFLASRERLVRVAAEGDPAPGGGTLSGFGKHPVPSLNASGTVAFAAAVTGGRTVEGIFVWSRGKLEAVVLAGALAPGIPSGTLAVVEAPVLNDRGEIAFLATVRRGRETVEALYLKSGGKLRKLVAQGEAAPAGGSFAGFGPPALNNRGVVAFGAVIEGRGVPGGVFAVEGGKVRMLAGAGEETPLGGIFAKFSERLGIDESGAVAVHAVLKNASVPGAILLLEPGRVRKIAALGDAAPDGGAYSQFGLWPALGASSAVAFAASVDRGPADVGMFLFAPGGAVKAAGLGDVTNEGQKLRSFGLYPVVTTSAGAVVFGATLDPGGDALMVAAPPRP